MKKMDQLMKELGFNANASQGVKEAFVKHLIKASTGVIVTTPTEAEILKSKPAKVFPLIPNEQMSFNFDEDGYSMKHKKAVS